MTRSTCAIVGCYIEGEHIHGTSSGEAYSPNTTRERFWIRPENDLHAYDEIARKEVRDGGWYAVIETLPGDVVLSRDEAEKLRLGVSVLKAMLKTVDLISGYETATEATEALDLLTKKMEGK